MKCVTFGPGCGRIDAPIDMTTDFTAAGIDFTAAGIGILVEKRCQPVAPAGS